MTGEQMAERDELVEAAVRFILRGKIGPIRRSPTATKISCFLRRRSSMRACAWECRHDPRSSHHRVIALGCAVLCERARRNVAALCAMVVLMTTAHSPLSKIRKQADAIAALLKAIERGENVGGRDPLGKIAASRALGVVKFAVVMDDKTFTVEMPWATIATMSELHLSAFIVGYMREKGKTLQ